MRKRVTGREASSDEMEREWSRIALVIAHKIGGHVGLDTAIRVATDADFSVREDGTTRESESLEETDPLDELHAGRFGDPVPASLPNSVRPR
jgi:hypothetical protein